MKQTIQNISARRLVRVQKLAAVATLLLTCLPVQGVAQSVGQTVFSSPEQASAALAAAAQSEDSTAMLNVLGPQGRLIISSGDPTEDADNRNNFVSRYQEMHRLVHEPDGTVTLYVGAKNWPTPIPITSSGEAWYFDTEAGKKEILFRRIGRNELSTIRVCQELVAAEDDYRASHDGKWASRVFSDKAQHNGLFWWPVKGEIQSPIGPLVAAAFVSTKTDPSAHAPSPFRGYYFRLLNAPPNRGTPITTAMRFSFVAFPTEYRSSGVMTFRTGVDGSVYERDLGQNTKVIAQRIDGLKFDASWHKVEATTDLHGD
jgi:hypothetical protein